MILPISKLEILKNSNCEKFFGIKIDCDLTFDDQTKDICKKANNKLKALVTRATLFMNFEKRKKIL